MKTYKNCAYSLIMVAVGAAASLLFVTWPRTLTKICSNQYYRENTEKLHLKRNSLYNGVESFVLFVGYPRSGHSLVGAILDSHPEIIIPHEFDLLTKLNSFFHDPNEDSHSRRLRIFSKLHSVSRRQAMFGNRSPNYTLGYSYHIPGSWQGKYRNRIRVIGDKKGSATNKALATPEGLQQLNELQQTVVVPVELIHVIRNPFDNIATMCLKRKQLDKLRLSREEYQAKLDFCINLYFLRVKTVQKLHEMSKYPILDVYSRDVIAKPRETLHKLCDFLSVTCDNEYVTLTSKILYSRPSRTRYSVQWTNKQKEKVINEIAKYQFLKSVFSFDSD